MNKGFEAWAAGECLPLERVVSDERYCSMETEYAWRAWQQQPEAAHPERLLITRNARIAELEGLIADCRALGFLTPRPKAASAIVTSAERQRRLTGKSGFLLS